MHHHHSLFLHDTDASPVVTAQAFPSGRICVTVGNDHLSITATRAQLVQLARDIQTAVFATDPPPATAAGNKVPWATEVA